MNSEHQKDVKAKNRLQLILLAVVVAIPVVIALLYNPSKFMNSGELVQPARPIGEISLADLQGAPLRFSDFHRKWTYWYFIPASCDEHCEKNIYKMRQVRLAQGDKMRRVQTVVVLSDKSALQALRAKLKEYPNIRVVTGSEQQLQSMMGQFKVSGEAPFLEQHRIYLVDPIGNLMMSYRRDADPTGMRKDIARLLRTSQIG